MTNTWSIGVGSSSKNRASRSKSVASKAAVLAPSSSPTTPQPIRVAAGEHDVGSLRARAPGRLQPDAGAAADHDDGLAGELRLAAHGEPASAVERVEVICPRSACKASTKISENVGNGWIVSRSTSSGTRARIASVACCSHSPASGPSA